MISLSLNQTTETLYDKIWGGNQFICPKPGWYFGSLVEKWFWMCLAHLYLNLSEDGDNSEIRGWDFNLVGGGIWLILLCLSL